MSTAARKERWRGVRHWSIVSVIIAAIVSAPLEWLPHRLWYIDGPMAAVQVLFFVGMIVHLRDLCERCIGAMPLDPEKAINREKFFLWLNHAWWLRLTMIIEMLLTDVFLKADGVLDRSVNTWYDLWIALIFTAMLRHSRLEPWCPWCRGGGGGGEVEEVPDPTDDHSKPLPV